MKKVAVGLSGGVDSTFAAYKLLKDGYDVIGVTMLGSPNKSEIGKCCSLDDINDAKFICSKLGIKHYVVDLTKDFRQHVINYFIKSYLNGKTPNPCIICNQYIKFGLLYDWVFKNINVDYFATGHYARIISKEDKYYIAKAKDSIKDQSYFLYRIERQKLSKILFPCGDFTKNEIKDQIVLNNLLNLERKRESFDVCFVTGNDYTGFIEKNITNNEIKKGYFLNEKGERILFRGKPRKNNGVIYYTIGQRKGIGFSIGKKAYVRDILSNGDVVIGDKPFIKNVIVSGLNLFKNINDFPDSFHVKLRYNHKGEIGYIKKIIYKSNLKKENTFYNKNLYKNLQNKNNKLDGNNKAILNYNKDIEKIIIEFKNKVDASSKGQSAVFYDNDIILGGGIIEDFEFV